MVAVAGVAGAVRPNVEKSAVAASDALPSSILLFIEEALIPCSGRTDTASSGVNGVKSS